MEIQIAEFNTLASLQMCIKPWLMVWCRAKFPLYISQDGTNEAVHSLATSYVPEVKYLNHVEDVAPKKAGRFAPTPSPPFCPSLRHTSLPVCHHLLIIILLCRVWETHMGIKQMHGFTEVVAEDGKDEGMGLGTGRGEE